MRSMTATVYVLNENKVLLHLHKKHNTLFPIGGHIEKGELPQEAALREVDEECGLRVSLFSEEKKLEMSRVQQLVNPQYTLLENIGKEVENIDFIYFATTEEWECSPQDGESREFYWLTEEEILNDTQIKEHIRIMAIEALHIVNKK